MAMINTYSQDLAEEAQVKYAQWLFDCFEKERGHQPENSEEITQWIVATKPMRMSEWYSRDCPDS